MIQGLIERLNLLNKVIESINLSHLFSLLQTSLDFRYKKGKKFCLTTNRGPCSKFMDSYSRNC